MGMRNLSPLLTSQTKGRISWPWSESCPVNQCFVTLYFVSSADRHARRGRTMPRSDIYCGVCLQVRPGGREGIRYCKHAVCQAPSGARSVCITQMNAGGAFGREDIILAPSRKTRETRNGCKYWVTICWEFRMRGCLKQKILRDFDREWSLLKNNRLPIQGESLWRAHNEGSNGCRSIISDLANGVFNEKMWNCSF